MMISSEVVVPRGRVAGVVVANAILWAAAIWVTGSHLLGGPAIISIASIATLLHVRR